MQLIRHSSSEKRLKLAETIVQKGNTPNRREIKIIGKKNKVEMRIHIVKCLRVPWSSQCTFLILIDVDVFWLLCGFSWYFFSFLSEISIHSISYTTSMSYLINSFFLLCLLSIFTVYFFFSAFFKNFGPFIYLFVFFFWLFAWIQTICYSLVHFSMCISCICVRACL